MTKSTHTFATLEVSLATYREIAAKLHDAGYDHAFNEDRTIDMQGIGLVVTSETGDAETLITRLQASAMEIDNRIGPIPGKSSDRIARELREAIEKLSEWERSFDLYYAAEMRAIKMWHDAGGDPLAWPDKAKLTVWLLERLAAFETRKPRPMEKAPKDATIVRLLIAADDDREFPLADTEEPVWTIGLNNDDNVGEGEGSGWQIVGWDWDQDVFVETNLGTPIGWLPFEVEPWRAPPEGATYHAEPFDGGSCDIRDQDGTWICRVPKICGDSESDVVSRANWITEALSAFSGTRAHGPQQWDEACRTAAALLSNTLRLSGDNMHPETRATLEIHRNDIVGLQHQQGMGLAFRTRLVGADVAEQTLHFDPMPGNLVMNTEWVLVRLPTQQGDNSERSE